MPKNEIDWGKPVEASYDGGKRWCPARVLCTDFKGGCSSIVVAIEASSGLEGIQTFTPDQTFTHTKIRNVPAPPVPLEFTRWVNVYKSDDGKNNIGSFHRTESSARAVLGPFGVTVPVTIRGEWKENEDAK